MIYSSLISRGGETVGVRGVIIDITGQKQAEEHDRQYVKTLEFLSNTATDYVRMSAKTDIYRYISDRLVELFPGSGNTVSSIDADAGTLTIRAAGGPESFLAVVDDIRARRPEALTFRAPSKISGSLAEIPRGTTEASSRELPPDLLLRIEALYSGGKIYGIGFWWEGELFGSAHILLPPGMTLRRSKRVSTFIHQTSIALQRQRVETELRESEEKYRMLFEGSSDGILLAVAGRVMDCNERACMMLGRPREGIVGQALADLSSVHQPDGRSFADAVQETLEAAFGTPQSCSWRFRRGDGDLIDADVFVTALNVRGHAVLFVTLRDVTERKRAEAALQQANRKLRLLSGLTHHDILNQVTGAAGYLEFLKDFIPPDPKAQEYLRRIAMTMEMIQRQIAFARDYEDMGTKAPRWWRIDTVVRAAADLPGLNALDLRVETGRLEIYADPMVEMAFANLFENAVRHGGRVNEIQVSFRVEGTTGIITVQDDGIGIPGGEKELIFRRGFGKNTGFGLFLIREILSITGITVTETGEEGRGARFEIAVPEGAYRFGAPVGDDRPA